MERPRIPDYNVEKSFDFDYVFSLNRYIEHLERKIELKEMREQGENRNLCKCIDRCSSKRDEFICDTRRNCIHKDVK